jgi:hypothetical protein
MRNKNTILNKFYMIHQQRVFRYQPVKRKSEKERTDNGFNPSDPMTAPARRNLGS